MKKFKVPILLAFILMVVSGCALNSASTGKRASAGDHAPLSVMGRDVKVTEIAIEGEEVEKVEFTEKDLVKFAAQKSFDVNTQFRLFIGEVPDDTSKGINNQTSGNTPIWAQKNNRQLMRPNLRLGFYAGVYDLESHFTQLLKTRGVFGQSQQMPAHLLKQLVFEDNDILLDGGLVGISFDGGFGGGAEADSLRISSTKGSVFAQYVYNFKLAKTGEVLYSISLEPEISKEVSGLDFSGYLGDSRDFKHLDFSKSLTARLSSVQKQQAMVAAVRGAGFFALGGDVVTGIPYANNESYAFWKATRALYNESKQLHEQLKKAKHDSAVLKFRLDRFAFLDNTAVATSTPHGDINTQFGESITSPGHDALLARLKEVVPLANTITEARAHRVIMRHELKQLAYQIVQIQDKIRANRDANAAMQADLLDNGVKKPKAVTTVGHISQALALRRAENLARAQQRERKTQMSQAAARAQSNVVKQKIAKAR